MKEQKTKKNGFYVVLAVLFPRRSLHDWIAGTYLMPD